MDKIRHKLFKKELEEVSTLLKELNNIKENDALFIELGKEKARDIVNGTVFSTRCKDGLSKALGLRTERYKRYDRQASRNYMKLLSEKYGVRTTSTDGCVFTPKGAKK